ncbi:MAG: fumarylacetoacetate hydrolase family protein [Methanomassiliicoccales archaeon]|nr:fumarylacetoacetate hydrolase family protein [Methanomassiliicoccales archaeon]
MSSDFSLEVEGKVERVRCQKIICVARNYLEHVKEMRAEEPEEPVIFLKAPSALTENGCPILIPDSIGRVDYEAELAVIIGKKGKNIPFDESRNYILAVAAFNDVTARDIQMEAKRKGLPWAISKSFDTFAPISKPVLLKDAGNIDQMDITLKLNGQIRQSSNTSMMIHKIDYLISFISKFMTLEPGDIIATGTPGGVGPMSPGDVVEITIGNCLYLRNPVVRI